MPSQIVYPFGKAQVTVSAGGSIAISSANDTGVERVFGYPNQPNSVSTLGTVNQTTGTVTFGSYASGATIIINAGASLVYYETGAAPAVKDVLANAYQGDPTAVNVTGAVSAAAILGRIVTSTTAAAVAGTIPTGTVMDASSNWQIGDSVDWVVINTGGANAFTVTAATDHTIVGAAAVAASTSGRFRTRKTAANTFVTYRV